MKKALIVGIGMIAGIFAILVVGYIAFIVYINWPSDRTIGTSVDVDRNWTEMTIDPPIEPRQRDQYIGLRFDGFKRDRSSNRFDITLPDGNTISPEMELVDESGETFVFHHSGFVMKEIYDDVVFRPGSKKQNAELPADRKYTRLRIRSDVPFSCDRIYWQDYDPK